MYTRKDIKFLIILSCVKKRVFYTFFVCLFTSNIKAVS